MRAACGAGWMWVLGGLLCVGTAAAQPSPTGTPPTGAGAASPTNPDPAGQARKLYGQGGALVKAGKLQEAHAEFRAAYAWLPHWQIAGALGDVSFALGKYPEAIEMLSQFLREAVGPDAKDVTDKDREDARKHLTEAKQKCGLLTIEGPGGAEVRIDTVSIGKLPLQKELYLLPGSHTVEVVGPAGSVKKTVDVVAGKPASVAVDGTAVMGPAQGPTATATVTATPPGGEKPGGKKPNPEPCPVPVVVLSVGAGVGLVVMGVLTGLAVSKGNEAAAIYDDFKNELRPCDKTDCGKQDDLLREHDTFARAALGVAIGSALLGVATGTVYFVQTRKKADKADAVVSWAPVVSPSGGGLVVRGSF